MPYLTPPLSVASINQSVSPQSFFLDTPTSQESQVFSQAEGAAYRPTLPGNYDNEMSLRLKNHICKSFEDDLFFCPRGLLSSQELSTCQQIDLLMLEHLRDAAVDSGLSASPGAEVAGALHVNPKFNPYTSQSFSPAPPPPLETHSPAHS